MRKRDIKFAVRAAYIGVGLILLGITAWILIVDVVHHPDRYVEGARLVATWVLVVFLLIVALWAFGGNDE